MKAAGQALLGCRAMVALSIETVLLMAAAYFIGAALACIIRRSLFAARPATVAERRVEPLPEVAARNAAAARFAPRSAPAPQPARCRRSSAAGRRNRPQDLQNIFNIDAGTATSLNKLGVTRYEQIAAWKAADVDRFGLALGQKGRISRENWIEQAQILAKGGTTLYALRRAAGEASTAAPTPDEGERGPPAPGAPLPRPMSRVGVSAVVVAPSARHPRPAAAAPPLVSERAAFASLPPPAPDAAGDRRGGADPSDRAAAPRRSVPHRRHHARDRAEAQRAGRLALLGDRAVVAGRGRAHRPRAWHQGPHRPRELDRAGARS